MSDPTQKSDRPPRNGAADRPDPNFTMPGVDQPAPQPPPGDAAMAAGMGHAPYAPARDNLKTAARGTEHSAPPPSPKQAVSPVSSVSTTPSRSLEARDLSPASAPCLP